MLLHFFFLIVVKHAAFNSCEYTYIYTVYIYSPEQINVTFLKSMIICFLLSYFYSDMMCFLFNKIRSFSHFFQCQLSRYLYHLPQGVTGWQHSSKNAGGTYKRQHCIIELLSHFFQNLNCLIYCPLVLHVHKIMFLHVSQSFCKCNFNFSE